MAWQRECHAIFNLSFNNSNSEIYENLRLHKIQEVLSSYRDSIYTDLYPDREEIIRCANECKLLISVEDHSVIGGLGSAICEVLCDECPKKPMRLGVQDKFGKSGRAEDLMKLYQIDSGAIAQIIAEIV